MSKFKEKIEKVFEHPTSANIDFKKLLNALEHYGAKIEHTKQNKVKIFLNDKEYAIPMPHEHTLPKDLVIELRHFLQEAGLTPKSL